MGKRKEKEKERGKLPTTLCHFENGFFFSLFETFFEECSFLLGLSLPTFFFFSLSCGTCKCFIRTAMTIFTNTNCANKTKLTKKRGDMYLDVQQFCLHLIESSQLERSVSYRKISNRNRPIS